MAGLGLVDGIGYCIALYLPEFFGYFASLSRYIYIGVPKSGSYSSYDYSFINMHEWATIHIFHTKLTDGSRDLKATHSAFPFPTFYRIQENIF